MNIQRLSGALRQIISAAIDIEHNEENPREAAQDIQKIAIAALGEGEIPDLFIQWDGKRGARK